MAEHDFESVLYFIQRNHPTDTHIAVFRITRPAGGCQQAHYWDWRLRTWREEYDIIRRFLNGFDADVESVTEQEAIEAIARIGRLEDL